MEFKLGDVSFHLPPLHITIITIIIIFFLIRWSKQLETRRFTVFIYFLISTTITPIFSYGTKEGVFQLWIPIGFMVVFPYLFHSERNHPSKMKASILGFLIALYQLILQYVG
ncbi:hypothetical protein SAMN05661091_3187 [Paenibacillus uliginis N3/975]|uniref:Uncharacterized protein n=1 Tax=Paenibacillus uliginis N3/975 TaxID=1313296 RepID=A0A1X7HGS2_9BACL|nr:hypothetical protein [Paenibacillus uliginis]SMF85848.1 hypothetical protein SAMN05661091_3187 [Paenibacillus uliginis N3/975]